jgi:hypothetical protein
MIPRFSAQIWVPSAEVTNLLVIFIVHTLVYCEARKYMMGHLCPFISLVVDTIVFVRTSVPGFEIDRMFGVG